MRRVAPPIARLVAQPDPTSVKSAVSAQVTDNGSPRLCGRAPGQYQRYQACHNGGPGGLISEPSSSGAFSHWLHSRSQRREVVGFSGREHVKRTVHNPLCLATVCRGSPCCIFEMMYHRTMMVD